MDRVIVGRQGRMTEGRSKGLRERQGDETWVESRKLREEKKRKQGWGGKRCKGPRRGL